MSDQHEEQSLSRRGFLAGGATVAASLLATADALAQAKKAPAKAPPKPAPQAPAKPAPKPAAAPAKPATPPPPTVHVAVIGLGLQGRDTLAALGRLPGANVAAICDNYPAFLNRGKAAAPKAEAFDDYRRVLERSDVQGVFIATPTHKHREIVLAALQAGKHVYLESPMAHTVEDARAIALAGKAFQGIFQVGQQYRANPQHHHVAAFLKSSVLGNVTVGRAQWHKKTSWRRGASTPEREREMNWRLDAAVSPGLVGEIGIHSLDIANWFLRQTPVAAQGFGSLLLHKDGRNVPDTASVVLEYESGMRFAYSATLTNSYGGQYEEFGGTDAAVVLRDERAWLFKEADAPLLGWEVYARKELYGDETGICLVADASKQLAEGKIPGKEKVVSDPGKNALYFACEAFLNSIRDPKKKPDCGPVEGYQACVTALKANEAVVKGARLEFRKEWFDLG